MPTQAGGEAGFLEQKKGTSGGGREVRVTCETLLLWPDAIFDS
jgi:hypothetical protein